MLELDALTGLDAEGVLAEAERVHAAMVRAETARFVLAAHWVDLHSGEALEDERRRSGLRVLPGMERSKRAGAHGTPLVAEFAAMELGAQLGMGYAAAECFQRDAVNVRHRHPRLWAELKAGRARVWQARAVARLCAEAGLDLEQTGAVDAATTPFLASLPWSRFESLVRGRIVEADPDAAEERARAAALARFVRTGQSTELGLKTLVARATSGDVIFFVAMVDRIAQVLAEQGDTDPVDVRRSKAIGILATPARALLLLEESAQAAADATPSHSAEEPDPVPDPPADTDLCPSCGGRSTMTGDPAAFMRGLHPGVPDALRALDPTRLLPEAVLYIHVSEGALRARRGVARMEGVGAITLPQVQEFLRHCNVRPIRVVDVAGQTPVDGYEVPARTGEALFLRNPACVSPWGTNMSRAKDRDHTSRYVPPDRGGPPGQTHMGNLGLLSRFPHRVKTHGRWRLRQPAPGVYIWQSPHGYRFRVDHTGTHALGRAPTFDRARLTPLENRLADLVNRAA